MKIVGAGLAGLLAAHAWPGAEVFEAAAGPRASHHALLRFRTEAVSQLTGIEFRPVTVRKGIWLGDRFVVPDIQLANWYVRKVTGFLSGDRSVWSLEPAQRFIAPETFYEQLLLTTQQRIVWGHKFDFKSASAPTISTAPLPNTLAALGIATTATFHRASIRVQRYRVKGADVFQTIYFPDPELTTYRASITGSLLICESVTDDLNLSSSFDQVLHAFGLRPGHAKFIDETVQQYGKIVPLPDDERKPLLHRLTMEHGVFSLGRFATWRNVLLDDVVQDIAVVRRLIKATGYDRALLTLEHS